MSESFFKALKVLSILLLFIVLFTTSIELTTFNSDFFEEEYEKLGVADKIKISNDDLMVVTRKLLAYMKDDEKDLEVVVSIDNEEREFFNQKEKDHMIDVKDLFSKGFLVRNVSLMILLASVFYIARHNHFEGVSKYCLVILSSIFIIVGVLIGIVATNFDKYFIIFHEMFFTNDLWILNPETDLLINLVPQEFFVDISMRLVSMFSIFFLPLLLASLGHFLYIRNKE